MSEALIFGCVFGGWAFLNLCGLALFHAHYRKDPKYVKGYWKQDPTFIMFTCMLLIFGVCYLGIRSITEITNLFKK